MQRSYRCRSFSKQLLQQQLGFATAAAAADPDPPSDLLGG